MGISSRGYIVPYYRILNWVNSFLIHCEGGDKMMKSVDDYISKQQAIDKIKNATTITGLNKRTYRALNMVIKALESERPEGGDTK